MFTSPVLGGFGEVFADLAASLPGGWGRGRTCREIIRPGARLSQPLLRDALSWKVGNESHEGGDLFRLFQLQVN